MSLLFGTRLKKSQFKSWRSCCAGQFTRVLQRGLQHTYHRWCRPTRFRRGVYLSSRREMVSNLVCIQESHWSRTKVLTIRERGLGSSLGMRQVNIYVYGRKFELETDHKKCVMFFRADSPNLWRALNVGFWDCRDMTTELTIVLEERTSKTHYQGSFTHTERHKPLWAFVQMKKDIRSRQVPMINVSFFQR